MCGPAALRRPAEACVPCPLCAAHPRVRGGAGGSGRGREKGENAEGPLTIWRVETPGDVISPAEMTLLCLFALFSLCVCPALRQEARQRPGTAAPGQCAGKRNANNRRGIKIVFRLPDKMARAVGGGSPGIAAARRRAGGGLARTSGPTLNKSISRSPRLYTGATFKNADTLGLLL